MMWAENRRRGGEPPITTPSLMRTDKDSGLEKHWTGRRIRGVVDWSPQSGPDTHVHHKCLLLPSAVIVYSIRGGVLPTQPLTVAPGDKVG